MDIATTIDFKAFENCYSLKEIHFENYDTPIKSNIYYCGVPNYCKIIVKDCLFDKWQNIECASNKQNIIKYSDYVKNMILSKVNGKIILSIIYIRNAICLLQSDIKDVLQNLIDELSRIANITDNDIHEAEEILKTNGIKL